MEIKSHILILIPIFNDDLYLFIIGIRLAQ